MSTPSETLVEFTDGITDTNSSLLLFDPANSTNNYSVSTPYRYEVDISVLMILGYLSVFIVGLVGNSCVVWVVVHAPRMRTVTNYLIVNLACIDIIVLLVCVPSNLLSSLIHREYKSPLSIGRPDSEPNVSLRAITRDTSRLLIKLHRGDAAPPTG